MPFVQRIILTENKKNTVEKSADVATDGTIFSDDCHAAYVNLVREIAQLARHSENIIMQIFADALNVAERWQSLKNRVDLIQTNADRLNANAVPIASAGNLSRFVQVEKHYSSSKKNSSDIGDYNELITPQTNGAVVAAAPQLRLFNIDNRPGHLTAFCRQWCNSSPNRPAASSSSNYEDGSTQTESPSLRRRENLLPLGHSTPLNGSVLVETPAKLLPFLATPSSSTSSLSQVDCKQSLSPTETSFASATGGDNNNNKNTNNFQGANVGRRRQKPNVAEKTAGSIAATTNLSTRQTTPAPPAAMSSTVVSVRLNAGRRSVKKSPSSAAVVLSATSNVSDASSSTQSTYNCTNGGFNECNNKDDYQSSKGKGHVIKNAPPPSINNKNNNNNSKRRCARRNTIAIVDLKNSPQKQSALEKISVASKSNNFYCNPNIVAESEYEAEMSEKKISMADEYFYDFAPFYRRSSKRRGTAAILSSVNQFFSLRRPKKPVAGKSAAGQTMSTSATFDDFRFANTPSTPPPHSANRRRANVKEDCNQNNGGNGLKQFFKRTLSLRLTSSSGGVRKSKKPSINDVCEDGDDYLYESFPFRRQPPPSTISNAYGNSSPETMLSPDDLRLGASSSPCNLLINNNSQHPPTVTNRTKSSNLPITVDSQVLNVASVLRNQRNVPKQSIASGKKQPSPSSSRDSAYSSCGKKPLRPMSIVSFGSLASLDLNERAPLNGGWYRQGYQLEYPDDCLYSNNNNNAKSNDSPNSVKISSPRLLVSSTLASEAFGNGISKSAKNRSHRSSPHSDASSIVDSNYSCDQEGYFTSMHRDSGLSHLQHVQQAPQRPNGIGSMGNGDSTGRGRSFSTHSFTSTVAADDGRDDDVIEPDDESMTSSMTLLKDRGVVTDVSAGRAFPPLCEISLSESSDNEKSFKKIKSHSMYFTNGQQQPTVLLETPDKSSRIDAFDRWLLSKFQAEMTFKQGETINTAEMGHVTNGWSNGGGIGCNRNLHKINKNHNPAVLNEGRSLPRLTALKSEQNNNDLKFFTPPYHHHVIMDPVNNGFNHTVPRKRVQWAE